MAKKATLREDELLERLQARYGQPAWAFIPHVRSGTGGGFRRTADGVAMHMYPSRGCEVHGFEIKSARSDWQKELSQPEKADAVFKFCDRWWVVAGSTEIVKKEELPIGWGLMVPRGAGLVAKVPAVLLESKPISRPFVAALLRQAMSYIMPDAAIEKRIENARAEGAAAGERERNWETNRLRSRVEDLEESIQDFEKASGLKIDRWNGERIGEAVKLLLEPRSLTHITDSLERACAELSEKAKGMAQRIEEVRAGMES